ncbi:hypothetical protein L916_14504 [Plasmopara halstedii]|uniref:endo-polygalacturonase n=1 Tax=Plasmopara halstedii TaxID=4781 RepID=A0A0P1B1G7_PLAHL|nr:hypothetical protein L916_14504 [Plasmopara halstedii]CEG47810.1 hypothetical protein L916_14504 [Plasmopara halstedii]|eukprot:XP_024584179.1 hypothetical protein L916_14504 [Plasmopara halstedii]
MKLLSTALSTFPLLILTIEGSHMFHQADEGQQTEPSVLQQADSLLDTVEQTQPVLQSLLSSDDSCNLTGTYKKGTDISSCSTIIVDSLTVPAGVTLDLSAAKKGAVIQFVGTTTFGTMKWDGPLVRVSGSDLKVKGSGVLDGRGKYYWEQGQGITRPVFFKLQNVINSVVSDFTILNMPYRTFSLVTCKNTTLTGITIDSRAGDGLAKNTDGFDLTKNDHITITNCTIYNQDDCLAMQSSTNTVFINNYCCGGHGISLGSIGGMMIDESTTVTGLLVQGNTIEKSENGIRIKAIIGLKGFVSDVNYVDNKVLNVENAVVIHSDYSKDRGRYSGAPTSLVTIKDIVISGLTGTATTLYDIVTNSKVVSDWDFSGLSVSASEKGTVSGLPSGISL